jgi:hypothetical protein
MAGTDPHVVKARGRVQVAFGALGRRLQGYLTDFVSRFLEGPAKVGGAVTERQRR